VRLVTAHQVSLTLVFMIAAASVTRDRSVSDGAAPNSALYSTANRLSS